MKRFFVVMITGFSLLSGCTREKPVTSVTGYVEGEWRYLAAPASGWVEELTVEEGDQLKTSALAFRLDTD
ncbi:efflux RND transporter periplasmic adaptor subunit [endosymbiont of unidentified scaly snail isolate Monju]|uniref:efflux RND transporter periplasmic adaptor subunit n=1 Tax=endosymbiont of unidentified scaly snail isolate Monju TaxID=1248727 RepID=UPI0005B7953C|nr:efflux RND transporter periplasmic adaptor subunit [endosymbiont of unidentified scaly snail isolate Monju]